MAEYASESDPAAHSLSLVTMARARRKSCYSRILVLDVKKRAKGKEWCQKGQREDKTALEETLPQHLSSPQEMRPGSVRKRGQLAVSPPSQKLCSSQK